MVVAMFFFWIRRMIFAALALDQLTGNTELVGEGITLDQILAVDDQRRRAGDLALDLELATLIHSRIDCEAIHRIGEGFGGNTVLLVKARDPLGIG